MLINWPLDGATWGFGDNQYLSALFPGHSDCAEVMRRWVEHLSGTHQQVQDITRLTCKAHFTNYAIALDSVFVQGSYGFKQEFYGNFLERTISIINFIITFFISIFQRSCIV